MKKMVLAWKNIIIGMLKKISKIDRWLILSFILLTMIGYMIQCKEILVLAAVIVFAINLRNSIKRLDLHFVYLVFLMGVFLFLLGKPIVNIYKLDEFKTFTFEPFASIMLCIMMSLLFLFLGERYYFAKNAGIPERKMQYNIHILRNVLLFVICVSFIPVILSSLDKLFFIFTHTYVEYYSSYTPSLPAILIILQQFFVPSIFLYLATFPEKKASVFALVLYILSNIASFFVGLRSPLLLAVLFSVLYMLIRYYWIEKKKKFFLRKKGVIAVILLIPVLCLGLMSYSYIRQGKKVPVEKMFNPIVSFIDQQGQTFIHLCQGYTNIDRIKENNFPGYTFGPVYDSIKHNTFSRIVFGTEDINGQTENAIAYGHDMKAQLSYVIYGTGYYEGRGTGSSYLFELYYDFGYCGIAIFSFILGYMLMRFKDYVQSKSIVLNTFVMFVLSNLMYVPRSNSSLLFGFIFNIYNIITYSGVFILYYLFSKVSKEKSVSA